MFGGFLRPLFASKEGGGWRVWGGVESHFIFVFHLPKEWLSEIWLLSIHASLILTALSLNHSSNDLLYSCCFLMLLIAWFLRLLFCLFFASSARPCRASASRSVHTSVSVGLDITFPRPPPAPNGSTAPSWRPRQQPTRVNTTLTQTPTSVSLVARVAWHVWMICRVLLRSTGLSDRRCWVLQLSRLLWSWAFSRSSFTSRILKWWRQQAQISCWLFCLEHFSCTVR